MIFRIGVTATSSKVAAGAVGVVVAGAVAEMAASTSLAITRPLGPEPCSLLRSTLAPLSRRMVLARGLMKVRVAGVAGVVGAGAGVAGARVGVAGVGVGVGAAAGTAGALSPSFPSRDSLVTLANLGMSSLFSTYMFTPTHHPNDNRNRLTNIHILTSLRH